MNIIFMGTPDFAVPSLKKIIESKHKVKAVVTAPDKQRGRGRKVSFTPVKDFALEHNLPVLQPVDFKDEKFINNLKLFKADLFVIVAFKILPKEVFTIPECGSFNLHASLLPKYRGAAPIQWALIKGEKQTGVTTFKLKEKVDTGDIFLQKKIDIHPDDNFGSLHDKLSVLGAEAVIETIDLIEKNDFSLSEQNKELATPAPKITNELCMIDWNKSAEEIHNLVRGLSPVPGAYFLFNNKKIKIFKTKVIEDGSSQPFKINTTKTELNIGCSKNTLQILELQLEGKKKLPAEEFLRGFKFRD